ncbi:hypothetical protein ACWV3J_002710 [Escherichia coli]
MGKSKGKGGKSGKGQHSVSFAQAWRDVMLKAMTTGQLVPITISIVLMIAAWRMPSEELGILAHRIIDGLADHSLIWVWTLCHCYPSVVLACKYDAQMF